MHRFRLTLAALMLSLAPLGCARATRSTSEEQAKGSSEATTLTGTWESDRAPVGLIRFSADGGLRIGSHNIPGGRPETPLAQPTPAQLPATWRQVSPGLIEAKQETRGFGTMAATYRYALSGGLLTLTFVSDASVGRLGKEPRSWLTGSAKSVSYVRSP